MADAARLSSAHITRLPPRVALYLQASIIVAFLAASSAPTPLYAVYQAKWGFTPMTITTVFGIYALAVLAALLTVGSLSDYVGRRPVLLSAIVIQAAGLVVLAQANGLLGLVIGRICRVSQLEPRPVPSVRACSISIGPGVHSRMPSRR